MTIQNLNSDKAKKQKEDKDDWELLEIKTGGLVYGKKGVGYMELLPGEPGEVLMASPKEETGLVWSKDAPATYIKFIQPGKETAQYSQLILFEGTFPGGSANVALEHKIPGAFKNILTVSAMVSNDAMNSWRTFPALGSVSGTGGTSGTHSGHSISLETFSFNDSHLQFTNIDSGSQSGKYRVMVTVRKGFAKKKKAKLKEIL